MDITQSHEGIVDNFLASKESQDFFVENEAKEEAIRRKIKKSKYKYRAHALVSVLLMGLMLWKGFNGMGFVVVLWVFAMFMIHGLLAIMIIALLVLASVASEYSLFFLIILGVVLINSYLDNVKHATKGDKGDRVSGLYHVLIGFMYGDSSFGRGGESVLVNSHIEKVRDLLPSGEINGVSDYFRIGISDDVCISGANVTMKRETRDSDGGTTTRYETRRVTITKFKNPRTRYKEPIFIKPQVHQLVGFLLNNVNNVVQLEDGEFEKKRDVMCVDPLSARAFMTPHVMRSLLDCPFTNQHKYAFMVYEDMICNVADIDSDEQFVSTAVRKNIYDNRRELCLHFVKNVSEIVTVAQILNTDYHDVSGSLRKSTF